MVVPETNSLRYSGLSGPAASSPGRIALWWRSGDFGREQPAQRRRLPSPSAAARVSGRTSPPTPRRAERPLPAAEKLSEIAPLPPKRSPEGAHFHPWLAEASAPPPLLRIARGQNPTCAVAATAAKIACLQRRLLKVVNYTSPLFTNLRLPAPDVISTHEVGV